ncbi:hypothetical protein DID88_007205 [Monilinia fructigena]|uniref:RRM domain-containing protein n=1 Tax=Monilinia fructigena TaxID=38457 RepID=A0A395J7L8_9HELO|nr:hypothetical protein DID88_007205 [Monilinia fructigena]
MADNGPPPTSAQLPPPPQASAGAQAMRMAIIAKATLRTCHRHHSASLLCVWFCLRSTCHVGMKTGRSRGYGFAAFRERQDAEKALSSMTANGLVPEPFVATGKPEGQPSISQQQAMSAMA